MRRALAALVVAVSSAGAGAPASAQEWHEFRAARQGADIASQEIEVLYAAGRLRIGPSSAPFLYDARVRYDRSRFRPLRAWSQEGDRGRLRLALRSANGEEGEAPARIDDWDVDIDLGELPRGNHRPGDLDLEIAPSVPTDLRVGAGASEARLELGGLSLVSLELMTGASEMELRFEEPNRIPMRRMTLKSGAAEFRAFGLGNARAEVFEFEGLIGHVVLDFEGAWTRSAEARLKMAVGDLTIRVPRGLGVRIRRSSLLASLDAPDFAQDGNVYVSPGWETADVRLEIELAAGFGSVRVERS